MDLRERNKIFIKRKYVTMKNICQTRGNNNNKNEE